MPTLTMRDIKQHVVPPGSLSIWWLGQMSFIFKSPGGKIIALDPYLSNSCYSPTGSLDTNRRFPPPIAAADLVGVDLYLLTHTHQDHLDPETLGPYRAAGGDGPFAGPPEVYEKLLAAGIRPERVTMTWPNKIFELGDIRIRTTFAIPFGPDDLTHVGYFFEILGSEGGKGGTKLYLTGDTGYEDILPLSITPLKPDVMITVINGGWRNLDTNSAAKLVQAVNPKVAIPCHYDLFRCNETSPLTFRTNLMWMGIAEKYRELKHGQAWTYPEPT
ncbi:MAG: MBL fold metallo-hydrolase [Planctomycetota bacterium]|nr:MBL fold metallo-hydrolase [Planctomycetota bacterium]